jgi:hypothetical protein
VRIATIDAAGTLGANSNIIPDLQSAQGLLADRVDILFDLRKSDRRDSREGIAAGMAMADAPMPSAAGRTSYAVNVATFRGQQAVSASLRHRLDTSMPLAVNASFSYAGNRNNGARVGVAGEF